MFSKRRFRKIFSDESVEFEGSSREGLKSARGDSIWGSFFIARSWKFSKTEIREATQQHTRKVSAATWIRNFSKKYFANKFSYRDAHKHSKPQNYDDSIASWHFAASCQSNKCLCLSQNFSQTSSKRRSKRLENVNYCSSLSGNSHRLGVFRILREGLIGVSRDSGSLRKRIPRGFERKVWIHVFSLEAP